MQKHEGESLKCMQMGGAMRCKSHLRGDSASCNLYRGTAPPCTPKSVSDGEHLPTRASPSPLPKINALIFKYLFKSNSLIFGVPTNKNSPETSWRFTRSVKSLWGLNLTLKKNCGGGGGGRGIKRTLLQSEARDPHAQLNRAGSLPGFTSLLLGVKFPWCVVIIITIIIIIIINYYLPPPSLVLSCKDLSPL